MSDTEIIVDEVIVDNEEIDTNDDVPDEIPYETALEWKKKADRLGKAEKALVEYKKKAKELEAKSETPSDVMTKADYAMERFLEKNPELADYTKELTDYTKKGLSLDEAKVLVKSLDKTTANREKLVKARVSDGEANVTSLKSEYTRAEVDRMAESDPAQFAKVADMLQSGKARLR